MRSATPYSHHLVRDVLGHGIAGKAFGPALTAVTAFLAAAERRLGERRHEVVDRQIPDLDIVGETVGVLRRTRERIAGEAVWQRVRLFDRLVEVLYGIDQGQRAE